MKFRSLSIFFLASGLLLSACKPKLPSGVLSEGKMERVLYDYHFAQGIAEAGSRAEGVTIEQYRYELLDAVCRKHGITRAELDSSLVFYCTDLERMNRIYKHVALRLEQDAEAYGAAAGPRDIYAGLTALGDTANVWAERPLMAVKAVAKENLQTWTLQCDTTWLIGDEILWRFQVMDLHERGRGSLYADLVVTYDNDSVRVAQQTINGDQQAELRVNNSSGWTPRHLVGHLYQPVTTEARNNHIFLASSFALIRFHKSEEVRQRLLNDTLQADTLLRDTFQADSLRADSTLQLPVTTSGRRLPLELRDRERPEQTIHIVKEKEYIPQRNGRRKTVNRPVNGKRVIKN